MKEIVVISGKGGTGKTSFSAAFTYLEGQNALASDCDVDAANMHLLLAANFKKQEDFYSGELAFIDEKLCLDCGKCEDVCRFDAIHNINGTYEVDNISCEGCHYCSRICPSDAISMQTQKAGDLFVSNIKNDAMMVHAKLSFGAENSGKLVSKVKSEAKVEALKEHVKFVITDGSPGIGCPVIASLSGASLVVLVTEATVSGLHDLQRVLKLIQNFNLKSVCIINKYDLNKQMSTKIEDFLKKEDIPMVGKFPYDEDFTKALSKAQTIIEFDFNSKLSNLVKQSWNEIKIKAL